MDQVRSRSASPEPHTAPTHAQVLEGTIHYLSRGGYNNEPHSPLTMTREFYNYLTETEDSAGCLYRKVLLLKNATEYFIDDLVDQPPHNLPYISWGMLITILLHSDNFGFIGRNDDKIYDAARSLLKEEYLKNPPESDQELIWEDLCVWKS